MVNIKQVLGRPAVHPFPARMAPNLAIDALSELKSPGRVLDPMAGSGTVLALGRHWGHRCIGFDVDPLAVLIARVWTRTLNLVELRAAASQVLEDARAKAGQLRAQDAYPVGADQETREFLRYWFDVHVRRQLTALAGAIAEVSPYAIREALWCSFSRLIIAKQAGVSRALDLAHSRPHRVYARGPKRPFDLFKTAVESVANGALPSSVRGRGPATSVELGDARSMTLADQSIDLVFTSPPYLNAIDYLRCSKFSLVWMGFSIASLRMIRSSSIGAEVGVRGHAQNGELVDDLGLRGALSSRTIGILSRYIDDSTRALREVARVLARDGRAVYVVGENTIRGVYIPTGEIISRLAGKVGLRLLERRHRELPGNRRYLPPPGGSRTKLDGRMRREVILTFQPY